MDELRFRVYYELRSNSEHEGCTPPLMFCHAVKAAIRLAKKGVFLRVTRVRVPQTI